MSSIQATIGHCRTPVTFVFGSRHGGLARNFRLEERDGGDDNRQSAQERGDSHDSGPDVRKILVDSASLDVDTML